MYDDDGLYKLRIRIALVRNFLSITKERVLIRKLDGGETICE